MKTKKEATPLTPSRYEVDRSFRGLLEVALLLELLLIHEGSRLAAMDLNVEDRTRSFRAKSFASCELGSSLSKAGSPNSCFSYAERVMESSKRSWRGDLDCVNGGGMAIINFPLLGTEQVPNFREKYHKDLRRLPNAKFIGIIRDSHK
jgi:hypothetical protein